MDEHNNNLPGEERQEQFPLDRTFKEQTNHSLQENEDKQEEQREQEMSFPLDRTFEDIAPKNTDPYALYNTRPEGAAHAANNAEPPKKKKGRGLKIAAVIIVAVMFGCALAVAVVVPVMQSVGILPSKTEEPSQTPVPSAGVENNTVNGNNRTEHDYSGVVYPETLPDFDGEDVTITNLYNPVPEIAAQSADSVVGITAIVTDKDGNMSGSRGTGIILSSEGYIVTNNHVIAVGGDITVTLNDGTEYKATLMGTDENIDIAVLKIDAPDLKAMKIGDSAACVAGGQAIAIGNPKGAGTSLTGTVTVGYISAVDREILFNETRQKFIQTDTAINPGNSGGPLLNEKGELIGVVTLKTLVAAVEQDGTSINAEGIGFAIPVNTAMESVKSIILSGDVKRPGLGVKVYEIPEEQEQSFGHAGLYIDSFIDGSLGKAAGLQEGDIIFECDGVTVNELADFKAILGAKYVGDSVHLKVFRDGSVIEFDIKLSDMNKIG